MNGKNRLSVGYLLAIAGLGGLLYGVDFGVIAAAEPYMKALGVYSDAQISHVVGAVLLGGLLSSITAGWLCDFFGRKKMVVASSAMFLVAIPIVSLSLDSFSALFAGRVLQGMSAGYMAVVMPMYLTETLHLRGLDPEATYSVKEINCGERLHLARCIENNAPQSATGRDLMERGLAVTLSGDYDSAVFEVRRVCGGGCGASEAER